MEQSLKLLAQKKSELPTSAGPTENLTMPTSHSRENEGEGCDWYDRGLSVSYTQSLA